MSYFLDNGLLRLGVRSKGAEMQSLIDLRDGIEHIWQAQEPFWKWHAPVLFPVVGACEDGVIRLDEQVYPMPKHGLVRHHQHELESSSDKHLRFVYRSDENSLEAYPFAFEFFTDYRLENLTLHARYEIHNPEPEPLWFGFGLHPAFALLWKENENLSDYSLRFEERETVLRHLINEDGLFDGHTEPLLQNEDRLVLSESLFNRDALILKDHHSRKIFIESAHHTKKVEISFDGFPMLGIWSMPSAPFVCVEPWLSCADTAGEKRDFTKKAGIIMLEEGERYVCSYSIRIHHHS